MLNGKETDKSAFTFSQMNSRCATISLSYLGFINIP